MFTLLLLVILVKNFSNSDINRVKLELGGL